MAAKGTKARRLACRCRSRSFAVRIDRDEQVALVTCAAGHHALLLDSRDYWGDVIQDGRPPSVRCRCKATQFAVALEYRFREDGDVREIDVGVTCESCKIVKTAATFEIDYGPTTQLVTTPLDPIQDPWLKAKRRSLVAFWKPADLKKVVRCAGAGGGTLWFGGWKDRPRKVSVDEAIELVETALAAHKPYSLLATNTDIEWPERLRDCWKSLPVVALPSPTTMNYASSVTAHLYYVEFAREIFRGAEVVAQPRGFLDYAEQLIESLYDCFDPEDRKTISNRKELARVNGL